MSTPRIEEYLEAIYKLEAETNGAVGVSRLAQHMGLSIPSASEMMKRFAQAGTIAYNDQREVSLTEKGKVEATSVIRRHRLAERFLTDVLGFGWDEVHEEACRLEHALSPAVEERLARHLGDPDTCPHGHPIPGAKGAVIERRLVSIADLKVGDSARIATVPEDEPEVLRYLAGLRLIPGKLISVAAIAPFGGPINLEVDGATEAIGPELAQQVLVQVEH